MTSDRPLRRDYARVERERRFLLERLPDHVDADEFERLVDGFVEGAYLRLRRVERPDGTEVVTKLGQKIVDPEAPDDPRRRQMTTIYLAPGQAEPLWSVVGLRATKRRYTVVESGRTFAIDVWEEPAAAAGTILAEVECDTDAELDAVEPPSWAAREVTHDAAYSSVALARRGSPRGVV